MRKTIQFLVAFLVAAILASPSPAQIPSGYVQTTATVPSLAGGSYGAAWTNLSSSPQLGLLGCVSTFQTTVNGNFDAYGHLSVLLADTAQICPSPSTWTFTLTFLCSSGSTPTSFQIQVPVTGGGSTEDITTQITAALPSTSCSGGGGGGGGNISGTGTTGFIPIWTGVHALGNSLADYSITTTNTFTFPRPVDVGTIPTFSVHIGPLSTMTASWTFDTTTPATALATIGGTQSANTFYAGPSSGSSAPPAFRALTTADLPAGIVPTLYYQTVASNNTAQTQRPTLNFSPRFTTTDSSSPAETTTDLATTAVAPGSYTNLNATVDAYGRVTAASSGSNGFTSGSNTNGYWVEDALGHIHQWGKILGSGSVGTGTTIAFPVAFTNSGSIAVTATGVTIFGHGIGFPSVQSGTLSTTGFTVEVGASSPIDGLYWTADGY